MPEKEIDNRGIYMKFTVTRNDGKSEPGEKHEGCEYFVLDLIHDEHAVPALKAYMESCTKSRPQLAYDIEILLTSIGLHLERPLERTMKWNEDTKKLPPDFLDPEPRR